MSAHSRMGALVPCRAMAIIARPMMRLVVTAPGAIPCISGRSGSRIP